MSLPTRHTCKNNIYTDEQQIRHVSVNHSSYKQLTTNCYESRSDHERCTHWVNRQSVKRSLTSQSNWQQM